MKGKVIIFTSPSGAGKTTVVRHLLKTFSELVFSVSATTRPIRKGETDGKDYYFLSEDTFKEKIRFGAFLEWEEVYTGRFYGTLISEVERLNSAGKTVVFDVDVKGALNIKNKFGNNALAVFVKPPSFEILIERLKARSTESESELQKRIERMSFELSYENKFDIVLINDKLEETLIHAETLAKNFLNTAD